MTSRGGGPSIAPGLYDLDGISNSTLLKCAPAPVKKYSLLKVELIRLEQWSKPPLKGIIQAIPKPISNQFFINSSWIGISCQDPLLEVPSLLMKSGRPPKYTMTFIFILYLIDSIAYGFHLWYKIQIIKEACRPEKTNPPSGADFSISPSGINYDIQSSLMFMW